MKKKVFLATIIILILGIMFPITKTHADSGWDSSYSGGSSGGSSWSSSSSSRGSNWSSSGGGFLFDEYPQIEIYIITTFTLIALKDKIFRASRIFTIINFMRLIILIGSFYIKWLFVLDLLIMFASMFILMLLAPKVPKKSYNHIEKIEYNDISDEVLEKYGIMNKEQLKQELYEKYKEIQIAWMNIDYDKLRTLLSDSLYNMYKAQLKALELKNQKNIMSDFEYIDSKIIKINKNYNNIELKLYLNIKMYDYVVNVKNEQLLKGNKKRKIDISYEITFEKSCIKNSNICPNCGAKITNNASNKCEYCDSTIVSDNHDWVMSKKICVKQK